MNFDKEFLCYLICMAWDRLDDEDKIKANEMMLKMNDKKDDTPKVEYINPEILGKKPKNPGVPDPGPFVSKLPADDISAREDVKRWHRFNDPFDYCSDKED